MKTFMIIIASTILVLPGFAQKYSSPTGFVSFFGKAPISDVDARNKKVKVELNSDDGEVTFDMAMKDFDFKNNKMGRDARKKYLETEKYTKAGFKGKIEGKIKYDKPGTYSVKATGKLKIHGVEKDVTEKGNVIVAEGGGITLQSEFSVTLADYKIETPKILGSGNDGRQSSVEN